MADADHHALFAPLLPVLADLDPTWAQKPCSVVAYQPPEGGPSVVCKLKTWLKWAPNAKLVRRSTDDRFAAGQKKRDDSGVFDLCPACDRRVQDATYPLAACGKDNPDVSCGADFCVCRGCCESDRASRMAAEWQAAHASTCKRRAT